MESMKKNSNSASQEETEKEIGHPADPKSPSVPVQVEDTANAGTLTENDDEKIILTLESLHYPSESSDSAKKKEENQKALEKLEKLLQTNNITRKKIVKEKNGNKISGISVISNNLKGEKKAPRILNTALAKSSNNENQRLLNNIGKSIPSEEDLLAILEGNSQDEESEVDVRVIDDTAGVNNTVTTVLLSKNQELKIAADQMKKINKEKRKNAPKNNTTNESQSLNSVVNNTNELVNSIASEWSDSERENLDDKNESKNKSKQQSRQTTDKKLENKMGMGSKKLTVEASEKKDNDLNESSQPITGIVPFKRTRVIKKKIIWDPDAPETQFSYASLIKPKAKTNVKKILQKKTNNTITTVNQVIPKKEEKPKQINNRKRKEPSPDKSNDNLEDVLNEILSEDTNMVVVQNSENITHSSKVKELNQAKKPRFTKAKPSATTQSTSWDYITKGQSDEMMIIRRRSSSYSSTASQRRMSSEQQQLTPTTLQKSIKVFRKVSESEQSKVSLAKKRKQEIQLKKVAVTIQKDNENSPKLLPLFKKLSAADTKKLAPPSPTAQIILNRKSSRQTPVLEVEKTNRVTVTTATSTNLKPQKLVEKKIVKNTEEKLNSDIQLKEEADFNIILKKVDSVINIILDLKIESPANTFSIEFIKKFISILENIKIDDSCKVIVLTSKGTHFCQGVDFSCLIAPTIEKRKVVAAELANSVRLLFESLINFNKPIIAAVGGFVSNLGVSILPLFDVVFASDKSAFATSYSKIGQIPEGNCILSTIDLSKKYKLKLIYLAEKLSANEALSCGLITAIYPTQRLEVEAMNVATRMASLSQQSYKSMKEFYVKKFKTGDFTTALEEEQICLVENWISAECQQKFKELLQQ